MELLENLGIDWKLVIAQIANFAVLLIVLRVFAYKPILALLEKRRKTIEKGLGDAEKAEKALRDADAGRKEAVLEGQGKAADIIETAKREAEAVKASAVREAERQAETILSEAREQVDREREEVFRSVRTELGDLVMLASKRLTREAISPEAHRELVEQTVRDIEQSNGA